MNKEDVRQKMLDIVGYMFNADSNKITIGMPHVFEGHTWQEAKDTINTAFDRLTVDHQKVKLPRDVGEELDEYKRGFEHDIDVLDLLADVDSLYGLLKTNKWLYDSDGDRSDHANRLIDAYRYGWEAEPEAKWYVKAPESWHKDEDCWANIEYGEVNFDAKYWANPFTRAELKQYHLDSDIFTLVPVGVEHG